jgi:hypothetical protein
MPQFPKEKIMKRILMTVALICVLSATALAGDIPMGGFAPPPPPAPTETTSATSPGDIPTGGFAAMTLGYEVRFTVLGVLCALVS